MTDVFKVVAVFALLNYCSAEIQNNNAQEWYSANVISDFSPKPLTDIFPTTFSTTNPIVVTETAKNVVQFMLNGSTQPTSTSVTTQIPTELQPTFSTPLPQRLPNQPSVTSTPPNFTNQPTESTPFTTRFTQRPTSAQPNPTFPTSVTPNPTFAATPTTPPENPIDLRNNFPNFVAIPNPNPPRNSFLLFPQVRQANGQSNFGNGLNMNDPQVLQQLNQNDMQPSQQFGPNVQFAQRIPNDPQFNQQFVPNPNIQQFGQNPPPVGQFPDDIRFNQQFGPNNVNMNANNQQPDQEQQTTTPGPVLITASPASTTSQNPRTTTPDPTTDQNSVRPPALRIRMVSPQGTVTNINLMNGPGGLQMNPSPMMTTRRPNRRRNNYDSCVATCGDRRAPICAAPAGVRPIDADELRGFPTLCHLACHNSFRKEAFERIADGRCGRLRTRIVPLDAGPNQRLRRPDMNRNQYTISDNSGTVIQVAPVRRNK